MRLHLLACQAVRELVELLVLEHMTSKRGHGGKGVSEGVRGDSDMEMRVKV